VTDTVDGVTVEGEVGMRATRILVAAAVLALAGLTVVAGALERDGSDADGRLLAAAAGEERDGWLDRFDGRLYADAETGCVQRWPGDRDDDLGHEDVDAPPRPSPEDHIVRLQEPPDGAGPDDAGPDDAGPDTSRPELAPPTLRGPWPLCEPSSSRVSDQLGAP
jgi:hypothetical protein